MNCERRETYEEADSGEDKGRARLREREREGSKGSEMICGDDI